MYYATFGLKKNPFSMTPDPAFLLTTPQHREALVGVSYAILQRKGFVVLTGDAGTGKTTIINRVVQIIPPNRLQFSMVQNPTATPAEFLEMVLLDFGISDVPSSKAQRLLLLNRLLFEGENARKISVLIVDEAHRLSPEVLEEIRLLGNFENATHKLLQILLVGQTELDETLDREDLRQFKQRIALRLQIGPLTTEEVGEYIQHRWSTAGGTSAPFAPETISVVAERSRGIPRIINSLCDNAVTCAFADGARQVEVQHIESAARDLAIRPVSMSANGHSVSCSDSISVKAEGPSFLGRWSA